MEMYIYRVCVCVYTEFSFKKRNNFNDIIRFVCKYNSNKYNLGLNTCTS